MNPPVDALGPTVLNLIKEIYRCGPEIGNLEINQFPGEFFHRKCLMSTNVGTDTSSFIDSTGLRTHAGSNVLVRFNVKYKLLFNDTTVCDLGCGTGIAGLCINIISKPTLTVFTDGNLTALLIAEKNCIDFLTCSIQSIKYRTLQWICEGDIIRTVDEFVSFDYIIGSELMYYSVDVMDLVKVVTRLLSPKGLFFHAHVFRKSHQFEDFVNAFTRQGWATLIVDVSSFISEVELAEHPEWFVVKMLISGTTDAINEFMAKNENWEEVDSAYFLDQDLQSDVNIDNVFTNLTL